MRAIVGATALALFTASVAVAATTTTEVTFARGAKSATFTGGFMRYNTPSYVLALKAGQTLSVRLKPSAPLCSFRVYREGTEAPIHDGLPDGTVFSGKAEAAGTYTVQMVQQFNGIRGLQYCEFSLRLSVT